MPSKTQQEIESWIEKYASKSDSEVRAAMARWKQHAPGWIAGDLVLKQRARENDPTKPLLEALNAQVTGIAGRMAAVEQQATSPAYKTWAFWLAIVALVVSLLALFRDVLDYRVN